MSTPSPATVEVYNEFSDTGIRVAAVRQLVRHVLADEKLYAESITVVFVSDSYLKQLHNDFLNDASPTDVMTFNLADDGAIEGEIYISVERAMEHAGEFGVPVAAELGRLVIHGLLHLSGMDDHTDEQRKAMHAQENHYLEKYQQKISKFSM